MTPRKNATILKQLITSDVIGLKKQQIDDKYPQK